MCVCGRRLVRLSKYFTPLHHRARGAGSNLGSGERNSSRAELNHMGNDKPDARPIPALITSRAIRLASRRAPTINLPVIDDRTFTPARDYNIHGEPNQPAERTLPQRNAINSARCLSEGISFSHRGENIKCCFDPTSIIKVSECDKKNRRLALCALLYIRDLHYFVYGDKRLMKFFSNLCVKSYILLLFLNATFRTKLSHDKWLTECSINNDQILF